MSRPKRYSDYTSSDAQEVRDRQKLPFNREFLDKLFPPNRAQRRAMKRAAKNNSGEKK